MLRIASVPLSPPAVFAAALLVAATGCGGGGTGSGPAVPVPPAVKDDGRVMARVNDTPIFERQVDELVEAEQARIRARAEAQDDETIRDLRRNALDLLIDAELVYQAALASGIEVPEGAVEQQLATVRSQFASEKEFDDHLRGAGQTLEGVEREARRRALMAAYTATITPNLGVDLEAAARELYAQQKDELREPAQVRVAQIIVRYLPSDPVEKREAARQKIEAARKRLDRGEDFATVARETSESPLAAQGGDMGWLRRGRTLPEFEAVVFALPVGATSQIFETRHGLNIVRVLERREGREQTFDEVRTGLTMVLVRERGDQTLRDHIAALRETAVIEILE